VSVQGLTSMTKGGSHNIASGAGISVFELSNLILSGPLQLFALNNTTYMFRAHLPAEVFKF
jgi:hypothetical protein